MALLIQAVTLDKLANESTSRQVTQRLKVPVAVAEIKQTPVQHEVGSDSRSYRNSMIAQVGLQFVSSWNADRILVVHVKLPSSEEGSPSVPVNSYSVNSRGSSRHFDDGVASSRSDAGV
jgi:hypothetical protein